MENAVAIIGMDCKFPGANSLEEYWHLLKNGVCPLKNAKKESGDKNYVNKAYYVDSIDQFDADFFNISAKDAKYMDPQQRLVLESAWKAFEDAGYKVSNLNDQVGVFIGSGISTYLLNNVLPNLIQKKEDINKILPQIIHGNSSDYLSSRISYLMNLTGPSLTVQTACSSALTAVHLACRSLMTYECDMALCGGVSINSNQGDGYNYVKGEIYSKSGVCSPFSDKADGTIFSGGVGTLVLKRYDDAIEAGDYVYAVILGSAINNDGADKISYTAPSAKGQEHVIMDALSFAGKKPSEISFIETHGTGTSLGDEIEVAALKNIFAGNDKLKIGSVKGNIGHAIAASGIAGLIKTVLCLNHKHICPSIHCDTENPALELSKCGIKVAKEYEKLETKNGESLCAGVSSFGMGGSNVHLIVEAYDNEKVPFVEDENYLKMIRLSAKTEDSLRKMLLQLRDYLEKNDVNDSVLMKIYNTEREIFSQRIMIWYRNKDELLQQLNSYEESGSIPQYYYGFENCSNASDIKSLYSRILGRDETLDNISSCAYEIKQYWESGFDFDTELLGSYAIVNREPLPKYCFDHKRYWIDASNISYDTNECAQEDDSDVESYIHNMWKEYLEVDESNSDGDFFELGGSSIVAYQMLADIESHFSIELDLEDMIENPTVTEMVKIVQKKIA